MSRPRSRLKSYAPFLIAAVLSSCGIRLPDVPPVTYRAETHRPNFLPGKGKKDPKQKGHEFFARHMEFVRANGFEAVVARAPRLENFWKDPEIGPWGSPTRVDPAFAERYVAQDLELYLDICRRSRDTLFPNTMPTGAAPEELMAMKIPTLIMSGSDSRHTRSASWQLKELMPQAELWNVFPPDQTGANTLDAILAFARHS